MKYSRRQLLYAGLGVFAATGVGIVSVGKTLTEREIVSLLRRRLRFLQLDETGLQSFAQDYVGVILAKRPTWNRIKYHLHSVVGPTFKRFGRSNDKRTRAQRIEDDLAQIYLLSSDFFVNGADSRRLIHYVAYYDPMRACGNPFARSALLPAHYPA